MLRLGAPAVPPPLAIAIGRTDSGHHVGLAHALVDQSPSTLHLAFHHRLENSRSRRAHAWATVDVDPLVVDLVSDLCRLVWRRREEGARLDYGFGFSGRFDADGRFLPASGESGLTCATFVHAILASAGIELIDPTNWGPRPEDVTYQRQVVDALRKACAAPEHVAAVEAGVGTAARLRPEELVAAACVPAECRPASCADIDPLAGTLLEVLARESCDW